MSDWFLQRPTSPTVDQWTEVVLDISQLSGEFSLQFILVTGGADTVDVYLDDISIGTASLQMCWPSSVPVSSTTAIPSSTSEETSSSTQEEPTKTQSTEDQTTEEGTTETETVLSSTMSPSSPSSPSSSSQSTTSTQDQDTGSILHACSLAVILGVWANLLWLCLCPSPIKKGIFPLGTNSSDQNWISHHEFLLNFWSPVIIYFQYYENSLSNWKAWNIWNNMNTP